MEERIGKYYKLFSRLINSKKYFFVSKIGFDGFIWMSETIERAVEIFEYAECHYSEENENCEASKKYGSLSDRKKGLKMEEYISKEAAVRYLKEYSDEESNSFSPFSIISSSVLSEAERALSEMPAADVQLVKRGRWIWVKNYRDCEGDIYSQYKCSCCDFSVGNIYSVEDLTHFCGNCGVRMDGEENE